MFSARVFPANHEWPPAASDLHDVPLHSTRLRLVSDATGFERFRQFEKLEELWCFGIDDKKLRHIAKLKSLETLHLDHNLRTADVSCLLELPKLKVLTLNSCSRMTSLEQLASFTNLERLRIENFKNVHDIQPLQALSNLKELAVEGSIWTRMTIDSLKPVEHLHKLEFISLTNLKVQDQSLEPLSRLFSLRRVNLPNFYPFQAFAKLSVKLPQCECQWFSPYIETNLTCQKCKRTNLVMLSGKGKSMVCNRCDPDKLARHIKAFEAAKNSTN